MTSTDPPKLPPAFEPFLASKAMKATLDALNTSAVTKTMANYKHAAAALDRIRIPTAVLEEATRSVREIEAQRQAVSKLLDAQVAQDRRKARSEQAVIESAEATTVLVDVAQKQEVAAEAMADLLTQLVTKQAAADHTNRIRFASWSRSRVSLPEREWSASFSTQSANEVVRSAPSSAWHSVPVARTERTINDACSSVPGSGCASLPWCALQRTLTFLDRVG
jgi:hypothetical protein